MMFLSFQLNTDSFIRSIYYDIHMLNSFFRKLINWERKGNFKVKERKVTLRAILTVLDLSLVLAYSVI